MRPKVLRFVLRHIAYGLLALGLSIPQVASACSCADRPITERYESSTVLFLATAGPTSSETDETGDPIRTWTFETVEVYKGDVSFNRLWSEASTTCVAYLSDGAKYLVSTDESGSVSLCSTWRVDEDPDTTAEIEMLDAYKANRIPELTEPWSYAETAEICQLSHQFVSGGGYLQFYFRFKDPQEPQTRQYRYPIPYSAPGGREFKPPIEDRGAHPSMVSGFMNLRVRFPMDEYVRENTGRVIIGDKEWSTRRTLMEAPWAFAYEVIGEKEAKEILAKLPSAPSVSIAWTMLEVPIYREERYPGYPNVSASTPYLYLSNSVVKFQECLERGVMGQ